MAQVNVGFVKMLQLCMAVVSVCQVLFMISRAPKVPWEAIYLPGTEAVTYGLTPRHHTGRAWVLRRAVVRGSCGPRR